MNSRFTLLVRIVLGVILIVFGSNKLFHFLPIQPPVGQAAHFMSSLNATGYIFPLLGFLEIVIGSLLLFKKWVAFASTLLAPISINILLFHLFLDIPGMSMALFIGTLNGILIYKNWRQYKILFA